MSPLVIACGGMMFGVAIVIGAYIVRARASRLLRGQVPPKAPPWLDAEKEREANHFRVYGELKNRQSELNAFAILAKSRARWESDAAMQKPLESSCNGDCNQGRNCDCAGDDPIAPARGIFNALLLSIPAWGLIALTCWWLA